MIIRPHLCQNIQMLYILSAIFLWSSLGVVIRLSGVSVQILIFFSCVISSLIIFPVVLRKEFRKEISRNKGSAYLLVLGPISLVNTFSFYYAYQNTSIANAVLTHYTAPVLVAFLAPVFLKEKLTSGILLSVAIATAGLWIMFDASILHFYGLITSGDKNAGGIFAGLLSGFAYAVLIIMFRIYVRNFNPLVMVFSQNLMIALILLPFASLSGDYGPALWAFAVMGIVHSVIAPVLYFRGLKDVSANRAAILGYLEPVCAIMFGMIFLHEPLHFRTLAGGALVLFSGYLTIREA